MKLSFSCLLVDLNWSAVVEVPARLQRFGLKVNRVSVGLRKFPEKVETDSLDQLSAYIQRKGPPNSYWITFDGTDTARFSLTLARDTTIHGEPFLHIGLESADPDEPLKSLMDFLGLSPEEPSVLPTNPKRTVFIAHRFDTAGQDAADRVARYLSLLGFQCVTGRGYAPGSVADKVKTRLQSQSIVVAIFTPGDEATWLVQESILSHVQGKPLVLLKESSADFKPGLLADHEFILFSSGRVEQTFIPLLEGLSSLGYRFSDEKAGDT